MLLHRVCHAVRGRQRRPSSGHANDAGVDAVELANGRTTCQHVRTQHTDGRTDGQTRG